MAEELVINQSATKEEKYKELIPQITALIETEEDLVANLANVSAALKYGMGFFWVGFYMVKEDQLVLGPFQGAVACTRISFGKGVCGKSWETEEIIIVPDVDEFPGHIACSSDSRSEIVLPLVSNKKVLAVLDIDSDRLNDFDEVDEKYLKKVVDKLAQKFD